MKSTGSKGSGTFVAVASDESVDRDGEVVDYGAFLPLPKRVPVHYNHDFHDLVGSAVPRYEQRRLVIDGRFAATSRGQEMRQLVMDGHLQGVSVAFLGAQRVRDQKDGRMHVRRAELFAADLVTIPSNRNGQVLAVRSWRPIGLEVDDALADAFEAGVVTTRGARRFAQRIMEGL